MTYYEFKKKYLDKKIDFDGRYGNQCVDLFRQYAKEVWGCPPTEGVEGAKDLWYNYDKMPKHKKAFIKVDKTSIEPGDVVIFDASKTNKYGHVAICDDVTELFIHVIEQDGFTQDGVKCATWKKDRLLGGLRVRQ